MYNPIRPPAASQLNRWLLKRRSGSVQRDKGAATAQCCMGASVPVEANVCTHQRHPEREMRLRTHHSNQMGERT